jgi:hypothetical protein
MSTDLKYLFTWFSQDNKQYSQNKIYITVTSIYFLPVLFSFLYPWMFDLSSSGFKVFLFSLLVSCFGSACLLFFLREWQQSIRKSVLGRFGQTRYWERGSNKEDGAWEQPRSYRLSFDDGFGIKIPSHLKDLDQIAQLKSQFHKTIDHQHQELLSLQKNLENKHQQFSSLESSLQEQRSLLEKSQKEESSWENKFEQLKEAKKESEKHLYKELEHHEGRLVATEGELEIKDKQLQQREMELNIFQGRVEDLNYEIRTLLELKEHASSEKESKPKSSSHYLLGSLENSESQEYALMDSNWDDATNFDAQVVLNQCVDIAQTLKGSAFLHQNKVDHEVLDSEDSLIDMRRLFECYRRYNHCGVIFFSPSQDKLLFANQQVKSILGWTPDRFSSHFYGLIETSLIDWKRSLKELVTSKQNQGIKMFIKEKHGSEVLTQCYLALIPSGVFANHVVGVLCPN